MIVTPAKAEIPVVALEGSGTPAFAEGTRTVVTASAAVAEIDRRRSLRSRGSLERHLGFGAVEDLRADRVGEGADARVIGAHRLIIVATRGIDTVLRALELVLERKEVLIGLE